MGNDKNKPMNIEITVEELYQTIGSLTIENKKLYAVINRLQKDLDTIQNPTSDVKVAEIVS